MNSNAANSNAGRMVACHLYQPDLQGSASRNPGQPPTGQSPDGQGAVGGVHPEGPPGSEERVGAVLEFLKRIRSELRIVRKVRVYRDRVRIFDVNGDWFEVEGVGYPDPDVIPVLVAVNTAFNRETIHKPTTDDYKEFKTGRRYTWAADRVM
jgi:hypothetical protein